MSRIMGVTVLSLALLTVAPARAQTRINAHHVTIGVNTTSVLVRAMYQLRTFLGLINASGSVLWCRTDGETAVTDQGIRLSTVGTVGDRIFFDSVVPQGAVRCVATTAGDNLLLVIEGR